MHSTLMLVPIALAAVATQAFAQTTVNTTITMIRTGWNDEQFAVVTAAPVQNPARCPSPDGYISHKSNPGYQTYLTTALAGFSSNSQAGIIVHNTECGVAGRPKLIGINLIQTNRTSAMETTLNQVAGSVNQMNGNVTQIASKVDRVEQSTSAMTKQFFKNGSSVMQTIIPAIYNKLGCPDGRNC